MSKLTASSTQRDRQIKQAYDDAFRAASESYHRILTADGVAGNVGRMEAAFELAGRCPDMSDQAVVDWVCTNVAADGGGFDAEDYERSRIAASRGPSEPGMVKVNGKSASSIWDAPIERLNAQFPNNGEGAA